LKRKEEFLSKENPSVLGKLGLAGQSGQPHHTRIVLRFNNRAVKLLVDLHCRQATEDNRYHA
jgi:hypothetical protein